MGLAIRRVCRYDAWFVLVPIRSYKGRDIIYAPAYLVGNARGNVVMT